jgi:hypothetical protein
LKKVSKTRRSNNRQQHVIGCEYHHIDIDCGQLTTYCTACVLRERRDQFIAARNGKPPWSMKAFVLTVHEIEHDDVVSSGIFADEFRDTTPWEWTKQGLKTI